MRMARTEANHAKSFWNIIALNAEIGMTSVTARGSKNENRKNG